jgi:hypothetical protein
MTREENLLFALYAHRIGILSRDQILAVCASLRPGLDVDMGKSLAKRNLMDERAVEALWLLVGAQINTCGSAQAAITSCGAGDQVLASVLAALKPATKAPKPRDPPTIDLNAGQPPTA